MSEELLGEAMWPCPLCTFLNPDYRLLCEMCDYTRSDIDHTIQVETESKATDSRVQMNPDTVFTSRPAERASVDVPQQQLPEVKEESTAEEQAPVQMEVLAGDAPADVNTPATELTQEEKELMAYCDLIEFPSPPADEEQGLENLKNHLQTAYLGRSYFDLLRSHPKTAEKLYYRYFQVVCPHKNLMFSGAIKAWDELRFGELFKLYGEWKEFLLTKMKLSGSITKDVWQMMWNFAESVDRVIGDYSTEEAWPSIIDKFVEWKYEKEGRTLKAESSFSMDSSVFDFRWPTSTTSFTDSSTSSVFASNYTSSLWTPPDYRGLYNQGATCYMNSLLQTLFMTPEFRRSLYRWKGGKNLSKEEEEDSIPLQLQRLFARLQFGKGTSSLSTQALTKSFGWTSGQAFVQHDVQELCRVLFDVVEEHFVGTPEEGVIQELYQGLMKDYVQCTVCGYESSRSDKFLDISLDIHNVTTLTEALDKFVTPEILTGSSRWRCSECNELVDARKGLKINELPYILMFQLKRFDFDYDMNCRIKLNNYVSFPFRFSLRKYIDDSFAPEAIVHPDTPARGPAKARPALGIKQQKEMLLDNIAKFEESIKEEPDSLLVGFWRSEIQLKQEQLQELEEKEKEEEATKVAETTVNFEPKAKEAADDTSDGMTKKRKGGSDGEMSGTDEKKGRSSFDSTAEDESDIYELYSVLVHSGSAIGGHYYAYIKSFEKNKWYEFNDSFVTEVTVDKIEQAFGTKASGFGTSYGASAYMLCYKRVDPERNLNSVPEDEVDEELRTISDELTYTWNYDHKNKDKEAEIVTKDRKWHTNDSSDDEADNEQGNTSDDMEQESEWNDDPLTNDESGSATTNTANTASPEVMVASKEMITEDEDLELIVYFKHANSTSYDSEELLEKRVVRVSSSIILDYLIKKLKVEFDLHKIDETSLALRDYNEATGQVGQAFEFIAKITRLRDLYIETGFAFMLEINSSLTTGWYSDTDSDKCLVLMAFEVIPATKDEASTSTDDDLIYCSPKRVFIKRSDTLSDLKQAVQRELGDHLAPEKQRLIYHTTLITKDLTANGTSDSKTIGEMGLTHREKLYVEYCEDLLQPSPALQKLGKSSFSFSFPVLPSSTSTTNFTSFTSFSPSSFSSSSSSSSSANSWRPKEKGIEIRRKEPRSSSS